MKVVNIRKEPYDIYIGRGTKWGNPYKMTNGITRDDVCDMHEAMVRNNPRLLGDLHELKEKILGCHCAPKRCHGDTYIKLIKELGI